MKTSFIGSNAYIQLHGMNEGAWYEHAPKAKTSITSTHANEWAEAERDGCRGLSLISRKGSPGSSSH